MQSGPAEQIILGIIIGLLIAIILLLTELVLAARGKTIIQRLYQQVEAKTKPTGWIFEPPSEADVAREQIIKRNDEQGIDTNFSDLYE